MTPLCSSPSATCCRPWWSRSLVQATTYLTPVFAATLQRKLQPMRGISSIGVGFGSPGATTSSGELSVAEEVIIRETLLAHIGVSTRSNAGPRQRELPGPSNGQSDLGVSPGSLSAVLGAVDSSESTTTV